MSDRQIKAKVERILTAIERRGERFRRQVLQEFDQLRKDLRAQLLAAPNAAFTPDRLQAFMHTVDNRVQQVNWSLRQRYEQTLADALDKEMANAIELIRLQLPDGQEAQFPQVDTATRYYEVLKDEAAAAIEAASQDLKARVRRDAAQLMLRDASVHDVARGLLGSRPVIPGVAPAFPKSYARLSTIARTELQKAASITQLATYSQFGLQNSGYVVELEWVSMACATSCDTCHVHLNGKRVRPGEFFRAGGWVGSAPPVHPNCKCVLVVRIRMI